MYEYTLYCRIRQYGINALGEAAGVREVVAVDDPAVVGELAAADGAVRLLARHLVHHVFCHAAAEERHERQLARRCVVQCRAQRPQVHRLAEAAALLRADKRAAVHVRVLHMRSLNDTPSLSHHRSLLHKRLQGKICI